MVLTRHLQISSSHVLMKFLNSSKVSVDLILTEFQIFGPREARICVKFIIIWSGHNKGILGLCSFWPWSISFFERNFSYTVAWIQAIFCSTYFCINVSLVGLFASVSSFCLCFDFTGINFWGMLLCAYYENNCEPIRTRKCRSTNWLINYKKSFVSTS